MNEVRYRPARLLSPFLVASLLFLLSGGAAWGWIYGIPGVSGSVDLPEGWVTLQETESKYTFSDPGENCFLHIKRYPAATAARAYDLFVMVKEQLNAEGDGAPFRYCGADACLADLSFSAGDTSFRGYLLFFNLAEADLVLMAIAPKELYESAQDYLLSVLDSFARIPDGLRLPGPVAQFLTGTEEAAESFRLVFPGTEVAVDVKSGELETAQLLIEREARILVAYTNAGDLRFDAWRRYYRLIYRDNYSRLDPVYRAASAALRLEGQTPYNKVKILLEWIQGFSYNRTGTLSDLESPLSGALHGTGDCDSRALLYLILLAHSDVQGILMVSERYSHAIAGIDIPGPGARFSYEGRSLLVAELTDRVAPGLIAADRADPAGWIGMDLVRRR